MILDLTQNQMVDSIRIAWAESVRNSLRGAVLDRRRSHQGSNQRRMGDISAWFGDLREKVEAKRFGLSDNPGLIRFVRILMTGSSNTCDSHQSADAKLADPRNCAGYAIGEIYLGTTTPDGSFHDILRHTPDQEQTAT